MAAPASAIPSIARPRFSEAQVIPDVLPTEDAKKLFELSKKLYHAMSRYPYLGKSYLGSPFSASKVLLLGTSKDGRATMENKDERSGDMIRMAVRSSPGDCEAFLALVARLDAAVRRHLPGCNEPLLWNWKFYSNIQEDIPLHGQAWHQDDNGTATDSFLYYFRDRTDHPTVEVASCNSEEAGSEPKHWDSLNPPNNSFVRFRDDTHVHRGNTTPSDGNKLFFLFARRIK